MMNEIENAGYIGPSRLEWLRMKEESMSSGCLYKGYDAPTAQEWNNKIKPSRRNGNVDEVVPEMPVYSDFGHRIH